MTTTRGGYRPNAKRPKLPEDEKKVRVDIYVKPATKIAIVKAGKSKVIEILESALKPFEEQKNEH